MGIWVGPRPFVVGDTVYLKTDLAFSPERKSTEIASSAESAFFRRHSQGEITYLDLVTTPPTARVRVQDQVNVERYLELAQTRLGEYFTHEVPAHLASNPRFRPTAWKRILEDD